MKASKGIIIILLLSLSFFCSCGSSDKKSQELKEAFAPFESSDQYVFISERKLYVGNRITNLSDITYEGNQCHMIYPAESGMYAYSAESNSDLSIDLVYVAYDTLEATLIKSLFLPEEIITVNLINEIFYFRMDDPETDEFKQIYFLYDMKNDQTSTIDAGDYVEFVEQSDRDYEHYYNFERFSLTTIGSSSVFNNRFDKKLYITDNRTGRTKLLEESLLDTCEEGKMLRSFDTFFDCSCAYEKDGYVYLLFGHSNGLFGMNHYFIMKYDFESHTLEHYASIWDVFTDDTIPHMLIPNKDVI